MTQSIFLKIHGDTPKNRVWSFLIVHQEYDYSMKDIAKYAKIGYTTLKSFWKEFAERKIVVNTRKVGRAKMYRLNLEDPIVKKFVEFYWAVIENEIEKEAHEKPIKVRVVTKKH